MDVLNVPRPDWMTEDLVLLEEQARRSCGGVRAACRPLARGGMPIDREVWTKAGAAGLLCAAMPEEYGGAGGSFAHEAVINREFSLAGLRHLRRRRCTPASSRPTSCITAPRSRKSAGCPSSPPANWSAPSP